MPKIQATAFDADGMADFLSRLDQIHLVAIHARRHGDVKSRNFATDTYAAVEWAQGLNAEHYNIYWTVNKVRDGFDPKPAKHNIVSCRYSHVDIDPPKGNEFEFSKAATIETLENLRCPATFIIDSGNGIQAFFQLDGDYQNIEAIERINLQVRHLFNADACQNADRLMRVPGCVNFPSPTKEARGRKPAMTRLAGEHTGEVYTAEELAASFPPIPEATKTDIERKAVALGEVKLLTCDDIGLTPFHPVRRAMEKPKGNDRSAYGYHAAAECVRHGLTDSEIGGLLANPDNPAAEHFVDQAQPMRAIKRAIGAARGDEDIADGDIEIAPEVDFTALVENGLQKGEKVKSECIKSDNPKPDSDFDWYSGLRGGMKEMVDTILKYAPSPRPELALGSAIALFAAAAGRRYQTPSGLMSNIYIVGLSPSGSGKNLPVKAPASVLINGRMEECVGGSEIVSGPGIMSALEASPSLYLPIDEMGKLVQAMNDPRGNLKQAVNVLLKMYSAADDAMKGAMYSNRQDRPTNLLVRPCLSLYGVATPSSFWLSLKRESVNEGLLPRFILIIDDSPIAPPPRRINRVVYSDGLIEAVRAVRDGADGHNPFPMGEGSTTQCVPYMVEFADATADDFEYEMRMRQFAMISEVDDDMVPFVNRVAENAMKLALVMSVSEDPKAPKLEKRHLEWGWGLSYRSVMEFITQVAGNVSENEYEAKAKAVEAAIRNAGDAGAGLSLIGKKCGWISGPERSMILDDLESRDVIEKRVDKSGKGRPKTSYAMTSPG